MAGIKALRKVQLGRETTAGTAVAATTIWRGTGGMIQDDREVIFPDEDIGYLSGRTRAYTPKLEATLAFDETPLTFEQSLHVFEAGIMTATPTTDTGSGITYVYTFPTTAPATIKTYTIEAGDNTQVEEVEYAFVTDFTISGNAGESWMITSNWMGRQASTSAFTSDITPPIVEEVLFSKTKLWTCATTDTIGTSDNLRSNTLLSATLNVATGLTAVYAADGNLYFSFVKGVMPEVTLDVTFEHDGTATLEKDAWRTNSPRIIRLLATGKALGTPGTLNTKQFQIDLAGMWESFEAIGDQDGNDIVTGTFRARFDTDANLFAKITVINELAAVP